MERVLRRRQLRLQRAFHPQGLHGRACILNEGAAPTLTVTGGTLLSGGPKAGQASVAFDAADADSGVRSVTVSLGGTVVGSVEYPCAIKDWSACKRDQASQLLQVDTTKVPNGSHEIVVTARDAANNALTRSIGTVTVANPIAGVPAVSEPNGAGASRLAKLSARFTTTTKRSRRLGSAAGRRSRARCSARPAGRSPGRRSRSSPGRSQAGATDTQIAGATTGADGGFSVKLPGGPSRTLTFAYTAFSGDATPTATGDAAHRRASVGVGEHAALGARWPAGLAHRQACGSSAAPASRSASRRATGASGARPTSCGRRAAAGSAGTTASSPSARGRTFFLRARVASPIYPFAERELQADQGARTIEEVRDRGRNPA